MEAEGRRCAESPHNCVSGGRTKWGLQTIMHHPCSPSPLRTLRLWQEKTGLSLRKSPRIVSTGLFPLDNCSPNPWEQSGAEENTPGVLLGSQKGTGGDRGIPGFSRSSLPSPHRTAPSWAPAAPASRKRSLRGCDSRSYPFPAWRGSARAVSTAPFKFGNTRHAGPPCCGFRLPGTES